MAKAYNANKFRYFVLCSEIAANGGSVSFRSYTDHAGIFGKHGAAVQYIEGVDDKGRPRGKWFQLSQQSRTFKVTDGQMDIEGKSMYDFIKNYPDCEGSPNAAPNATPLFRELNAAKDAKVAINANKLQTKAKAKVFELEESGDGETLSDLAAHIGYFGDFDELMVHKIAEWAGKLPEDFFEVLNSGDRSTRALVRRALNDGVFSKKGPVIFWESTIIGNDEDVAVAKLKEDDKMMTALAEKMKIKMEPKKGGRPKKDEK